MNRKNFNIKAGEMDDEPEEEKRKEKIREMNSRC
jgi:hypothetical protein